MKKKIFLINTLHSFFVLFIPKGGGATASHGLSFINQNFIITADNSKPLLHIWPVNSQEQVSGLRFVIPGKVTALAVSPDGVHCVAAVSETIYIWHISSGSMLAMISRHYQSIAAIAFTDDGSHFLSAGQDGLLLVWKLSGILTNNTYLNKDPLPVYTFSDNTLPITDIFVGNGGMRALVASVSLDRTCRLYDLASGTLLLNLVFPDPLTSVTIDRLDTKVYVGTYKGNIFEFSLQSPPRAREYHINNELLKTKQRFLGHKGPVTALSVSLDGETLLSGGNDETVHLWHIPSKQLTRSIPHKGAITNAKFILAPKAMFDHETKLNLITNSFKRMIEKDTHNQVIEVMVSQPVDSSIDDEINGISRHYGIGTGDANHLAKSKQTNGAVNGSNDCNLSEIDQLRSEVQRLKKINKELFEHSVKNVLK